MNRKRKRTEIAENEQSVSDSRIVYHYDYGFKNLLYEEIKTFPNDIIIMVCEYLAFSEITNKDGLTIKNDMFECVIADTLNVHDVVSIGERDIKLEMVGNQIYNRLWFLYYINDTECLKLVIEILEETLETTKDFIIESSASQYIEFPRYENVDRMIEHMEHWRIDLPRQKMDMKNILLKRASENDSLTIVSILFDKLWGAFTIQKNNLSSLKELLNFVKLRGSILQKTLGTFDKLHLKTKN